MRRLMIGTFGAAICAVSLAARAGTGLAPNEPRAESSRAAPREIVAVYIGDSGVNNATALREAVRGMNTLLRQRAEAAGDRFQSVGASLEPQVEAARADLETVGPFDEVALGGNWRNTVVTRYAVRDVPEVVLVERPAGAAPLNAGDERELARFVGLDEITKWVRAGAPLPSARH